MADNQEAAEHGGLHVVRTEADGVVVLSLRGEIDHQNAGAITRAVPPADPTAGHRVVVDLSRVTFMDSSGINALIAVHQSAQAARGWLRLAGAQGPVLRTVQLVGLDTIVTCHPTVQDALAR
ncbi:STAS domain-containing protein [Streptomyces cylindrosporus]|uniref:Anti-sigma factor antagonist n=1 Tax=Streptomyces cylindrosporus TaxID=2927583 RepID=A0ABS9YAK1_9ACTN|nr:STAS domain-containing protein [Streptomyces cylindrosporus]MCI3273565.1 STAS domain-containing protein [Streptomyces cylindrosporus]